jgi:polyphosphate kinase
MSDDGTDFMPISQDSPLPLESPAPPSPRPRSAQIKKKSGARAKVGTVEPSIDRDALLTGAWINRDLAWLEFNRRVLHQALDKRTPLLERVKFLAIFSSNLDEFFMKRVGLLRSKADVEASEEDTVRLQDTRSQLAAIRGAVLKMMSDQARCYREEILPALAANNIWLSDWDALTAGQKAEAAEFFDRNVSPALTPLGLDPAHPFPFISNLSTNWGFLLEPLDGGDIVPVRVKVPTMLLSWIPIVTDTPVGARRFLRLGSLIRASADKLFPGMRVVDATMFRILRNAEMELDEDDSDSLRESIVEALKQRRFQPVVRIDVQTNANRQLTQALTDRFNLTSEDLYEGKELLDYTGLFQIAGLDIAPLRDPHWAPLPPVRIPHEDVDIFAVVESGDILLHHPYDSFDLSVENFISDAADDPDTIAIKMTVYRIGDDTPFVRSLIRAAESGKQVACVIELKARFDEARNLVWARELEKVGAHVTYGVLGLKTHTKVALVVRKQGHDLRCYAHIGTGNYHVKTARLYTDVGLLTCDRHITADVVKLFHYLTGHSGAPTFERLLVAPVNMREGFIARIEREVAHHRAGRPARIIAKMNQVEDHQICRALAIASQAGVPVDLIVRGFCCLAPGVKGLTENIRVRSIIGRFLEHSRVFYFADGKEDPFAGDYLIGSADWMYRNLSQRVEAVVPIAERALREQLWEVLQVALVDQRQAWVMRPDGGYDPLQPAQGATGPAAIGSHATFIESSAKRWAALAGYGA